VDSLYLGTGGKYVGSYDSFVCRKKVNPDASLAFYVGNLVPDAHQDGDARSDKKIKSHFYDAPDRNDALRKFALTANNDYLKGYLLHLFADIQFHAFWKKNTTFPPYKFGEESFTKFMEENKKNRFVCLS